VSIDDRTGKQVMTVPSQAGETWANVAGSADDRTFLLTGDLMDSRGSPDAAYHLYLLRIAPGTAHQYRLTKLPITPPLGMSHDAALSPDGRQVALLSLSPAGSSTHDTSELRIYSVSSGTPLRTWTTNLLPSAGQNIDWLADGRHVAFNAPAVNDSNVDQERVIDAVAPSGDLVTRSQVVFTHSRRGQPPCESLMLTPDGGTVICGTAEGPTNAKPDPECGTRGPARRLLCPHWEAAPRPLQVQPAV
jgi:hypothetical protein